MRQKIKGIISCLVVVILTSLSMVISQDAFAAEISGQKHALDVNFVLDVSGSMKTNDPDGIALDMVKAFIDTVHIQNIRIGFVAYNDKIVTSTSPVPIMELSERERLKELIDTVAYSGNTDIGLGLTNAYQSMPKEEGRNRIIVLISDGESDLKGSNTGRTLEQSNQELRQTVEQCREEEIPVYTIAFGSYDGSKEILGSIAEQTGASTYSAPGPELLIEVLYDIFNNNLSYRIQKVSTGIYARGSQEIRCILDEVYLSEIDILLISPRKIEESRIQYGENQIPITKTSYYAVGKMEGHQISREIKELTVNTDTAEGQLLDIYVISYRDLEPVLNIETKMFRNRVYPYEVYFKEKDGSVIRDHAFYQAFEWDLDVTDSSRNPWEEMQNAEVKEGVLQGSVVFGRSGEYLFTGEIHDNLGAYQFQTRLIVENTPPVGGLPEISYTHLSKGGSWNLDDYYQDAQGDRLTYVIEAGDQDLARLQIDDGILSITPLKSGTCMVELRISDGEAVVSQSFQIRIVPFWQTYWWLILMAVFFAGIMIWRFWQRPKAEPEKIADIKSQHRFNGRLDLYFTLLPEAAGEIPPLVFPMHKVRGSKIRLGDLLQDYPEEAAKLGLDQIWLIADEERKMILYHMSDSTIMIGNSIACKQVRYSVSFGDVLYITTADGTYDLELHYISVIQ